MKKKYKILIGICFVIVITIISYFDAMIYQNPIMVVTSVEQISSLRINDDNNKQITQKIQGFLIDNDHRKVNLINQYLNSEMTDYKVHPGQELILSKNKKIIQNVKRDYIVIFILAVLLLLLICIVPSIIEVLKLFILYLVIYISFISITNHSSTHVLLWTILVCLITLISTVLLLFGKKIDSIYLLLAIIFSIAIAVVIGIACLKISNFQDLNFELSGAGMQPYIDVFISQIILSVSGVILDESIDITASLKEIQNQNEIKDRKEIFSIGMNIGKDLVGPLSGILFFIIIATHLNELTVYLSNNYPQKELFKLIISPDIAQFLISVLGIVLAVPITSYIFSRVLIKKES
ncbi:YibE/F family protein [Companilactobacillus sp. DQM5]|uniref:YibE/F family protein n=1 Tax=Companilactobacillus sp. DQM5 TaxID=3463359 RepID=UPI0040596F29